MYNKNSRGPRADLWGTPKFITVRPESKLNMDTIIYNNGFD